MSLHPCILAARASSMAPAEFGRWQIIRRNSPDRDLLGFPTQTMLCRWSWASLHMSHGEIVMDDSLPELRRHMPIFVEGRGRILKTGLGLGCVVRGLLEKAEVEHIDVVEVDADIIRHCGAEFAGNPRVTIHHADAHTWDFGGLTWDYVWHDVHDNDETEATQIQHARLIARYIDRVPVERQGAWAFPRIVRHNIPMLGSKRRVRLAA